MSRPAARWIVAIAILAAARVAAFALAFPFFHGIDEHLHVDVVWKYARGFLPGPEEASFEESTARLVAAYGSPEFLAGPADFPAGRIPTPDEHRAARPPGSAAERVALRQLTRRTNVEADAPPTYYLAAGAWLRLGRAIGLDGLALLYWLRAIGPLALALSVIVLGDLLARHQPPDAFLRLAPLALLAAWPNDLLYGVTPDVASVLLGTLVFAGLVRIASGGAAGPAFYGTGLALGAAFLNKYSNLLLVLVAAGVFAAQAVTVVRRRAGLATGAARWGLLAIAAGLPVLWWLERNVRVLGSLTGQHRKIAWMQWTPLTPEQRLEHPLAGLAGWPRFLHALTGRFWSGELAWHGEATNVPWVDGVYVATTALFLGLAAVALVRRRVPAPAWRLEAIALATCAAAVAVLAGISVLFDYGVDEGPLSRAHPFFSSGRLAAAAAAPFAVLYCRGIDRLWSRAGPRALAIGRWTTLGLVLALALASEIAVSASAFASPWNAFHLR